MIKLGLRLLLGCLIFILNGCDKKDDFPYPENSSVIKGNLIDCSNNPITNGHLQISFKDEYNRLTVKDILINSEGEFEVTRDSLVQNNVLVRAFDLKENTVSKDFVINFEPNTISNLPDIEVCTALTEKVCLGDVVIENQAELDFFGNLKYTKVEGDLLISGVTDLNPLKSLRQVKGDLGIGHFNEEWRISAGGTDNFVHTFYNRDLKTLQGLENVSIVNSRLSILGAGITNLDGLRSLTSVEELHIDWNDELINMDGLEQLTTIGSNLFIGTDNLLDGIIDSGNGKLKNLNGFKKLESIESLYLRGNTALESLTGLPRIEKLKVLAIAACPSLQNLQGLNELTSVENLAIGSIGYNGQYIPGENIGLTHLDELSGLAGAINELSITNNPNLQNLDGLSGLTAVTFWVDIYGNKILNDFCGISNVSTSGVINFRIGTNLYNPIKEQLQTDACKAN